MLTKYLSGNRGRKNRYTTLYKALEPNNQKIFVLNSCIKC